MNKVIKSKLTEVQKRAFGKLSLLRGQSAYDLQESLSTLRALVHKGYATEYCRGLGSLFSPTGCIFRRKTND